MSELAVVPERVGGLPERWAPDAVYLAAISGKNLPDSMVDGFAAALAERLGVEVPEQTTGQHRIPDPTEVTQGLSTYPASLITLHAAAEILDGYRTTGAKVAKGTVKTVDVVSGLGESVLGFVSDTLKSRNHPIASGLVRVPANLAGLTGLLATGIAERNMSQLSRAAGAYIRHAYNVYTYDSRYQGPWMWASLLGRLSKVRGLPDEALLRVTSRFISSFEQASLTLGAAAHVRAATGDAYYDIVGHKEALDKLVGGINSGAQFGPKAQEAKHLLANIIRRASSKL